MQLFEWMVKPTQQTEWIEGKGILCWLPEVFTSLGAGLFLVALYFDSLVGMLVAWLIIVVLDIPLRLLDYGKPLRFWRTVAPLSNAWKTSWFNRGVTFASLFSGLVFVQLCISYWLPGTAWDVAFKVVAGILAFLVGIYSGFIMNFCRSIPFWNSALLPILIILNGICDGFFLMMAVGLGGAKVDIMAAATGSLVLLIASTLIIAIYLWSQTYTSLTAKYSVTQLIRGYIAPVFWIGTVVLGTIIPLVILVSSYFAGAASSALLIVAISCHILGAFALRYCLLKAGIYEPLVPGWSTMLTATK